MTRRPFRRTKTSPCVANRHSLGRRTAWLPPFWKSFARATFMRGKSRRRSIRGQAGGSPTVTRCRHARLGVALGLQDAGDVAPVDVDIRDDPSVRVLRVAHDRDPARTQELDQAPPGIRRAGLAELGRVDASKPDRLRAHVERVAVVHVNAVRRHDRGRTRRRGCNDTRAAWRRAPRVTRRWAQHQSESDDGADHDRLLDIRRVEAAMCVGLIFDTPTRSGAHQPVESSARRLRATNASMRARASGLVRSEAP